MPRQKLPVDWCYPIPANAFYADATPSERCLSVAIVNGVMKVQHEVGEEEVPPEVPLALIRNAAVAPPRTHGRPPSGTNRPKGFT